MLVKESKFYTKGTLNIFTDASIFRQGNNTIGCPGYICVTRGDIVEQETTILHNTTSNNSEIYAIKMGVLAAIKHKNEFNKIRLFSDSQLCIFALRDRIFKWVTNPTLDGYLTGTEGTPIANQDIILEIIYLILEYNLNIEFYHQKGHVQITNKDSLFNAISVYCSSNGFRTVDTDLIITLSNFNNYIDNVTRLFLKQNLEMNANFQNGIQYMYLPFDTEKYQGLINKKGK